MPALRKQFPDGELSKASLLHCSIGLTDKFGRVKVQFYWDRQGQSDENSSAWLRVGALHAGQESGFTSVPEVGDEVLVAFLEGDPDQPIILGSVYNPDRLPPSR